MGERREGPSVAIIRHCGGCAFEVSEHYRCQGDSGFDYCCTHGDERRSIGTTARTPEWCPLAAPVLTPAEAAALTQRAERAERERDELRRRVAELAEMLATVPRFTRGFIVGALRSIGATHD